MSRQGEGQVKIEMQFLADMYVTCDVCHGRDTTPRLRGEA